jgi:heme A synthase
MATVFCTTTALGLALQVALQVTVGTSGLALALPQQFQVFGAALLLGTVVLAATVALLAARGSSRKADETEEVLVPPIESVN